MFYTISACEGYLLNKFTCCFKDIRDVSRSGRMLHVRSDLCPPQKVALVSFEELQKESPNFQERI